MCAFFDLYITQSLLPRLQLEFDVGVAAVSLTVFVATLAVACAAPLAGGLADRFGRRRVLLSSIALLTVATFGGATAHGLPQLLAWRAAQGLAVPGVFTSMAAYIAEEWPAAEAATVAGLYVAGTVLGGFCGRFISGIVTAWFGWRWAFLTLGLLNLACLPLVAWLLPPSRRFVPVDSLLASLSGVRRHLRNRPLLATYGIGFALLFSQVGCFTYVNFYLSAPPFGLSLHALSFVFCVFLVGIVVTPVSGAWSMRWGARKVGMAAMAMSAAGLLLTLRPLLPQIIVGLTLSSSGVFIVQSLATAKVPRLAHGARSAAVGLYVSCYYFGGSGGASLPSAIWSQAGWLGCVALLVTVQLIGIALISFAWRAPGVVALLETPMRTDV
ncbi:MAG: MFS transporter [Nevskia sp.]|nr:MFS transporter [Nevskia sp.]